MSLSEEYKRQHLWRDWPTILRALPPLAGQMILDLGCGIGEQAAEFVSRGAHVIGIDSNEELIQEAQARRLSGAEFRCGDLLALDVPNASVDGLWCSFTAAYFCDLPAALTNWSPCLRPEGWIAIMEIDNMFGHEPLDSKWKSLLDAYAADGLKAGRYDFHMGRKLHEYLQQSGFGDTGVLTLEDRHFSFSGPALPEVVAAWRSLLDRMKLLHHFCGSDYDRLKDAFLNCLVQPNHLSMAKVYLCVATKFVKAIAV